MTKESKHEILSSFLDNIGLNASYIIVINNIHVTRYWSWIHNKINDNKLDQNQKKALIVARDEFMKEFGLD